MSVQHFLLVYDRGEGELLREQVFDLRSDALKERFTEELNHRAEGDNIEVVVVSAATREDLMRTHARYFLSLEELADLMRREA